MELELNARIRMKKPHPCGSDIFRLVRIGQDVKIQCEGCGHIILLPRGKLLQNMKGIEEDHRKAE